MDTVRLADILAYRLREHLGAQVDYNATLMPNELAIHVEMIQPEYLRGLTFTFRENEPLPAPILAGTVERWENTPMAPNTWVPMTNLTPGETTFQYLPANPLAYDIETRTIRGNPVPATRVRTEEEQV